MSTEKIKNNTILNKNKREKGGEIYSSAVSRSGSILYKTDSGTGYASEEKCTPIGCLT